MSLPCSSRHGLWVIESSDRLGFGPREDSRTVCQDTAQESDELQRARRVEVGEDRCGVVDNEEIGSVCGGGIGAEKSEWRVVTSDC